jgi:hypothetical protein
MDLPEDLNRLRLPESSISKPTKPIRLPRHKPGERFLRGPIPMAWLCRAGELPGTSLRLALALWHHAALQKDRTVKLSTKVRIQMGLENRHAVYRALEKLEGAELVSVERHQGRCSLVTIKDLSKVLPTDLQAP